MPKPLLLYRVDAQDGRAWLVLSATKPNVEQAAEMCGLRKNEVVSICNGELDDAKALTPDAEEFVGLIITEE